MGPGWTRHRFPGMRQPRSRERDELEQPRSARSHPGTNTPGPPSRDWRRIVGIIPHGEPV